jgi:hypothetical protein
LIFKALESDEFQKFPNFNTVREILFLKHLEIRHFPNEIPSFEDQDANTNLNVEFAEEVECHHSVQIDHHQGHHDGQNELLEIVGDRLENGLEHGEGEHNVDEQKGVEEGGQEDAEDGAEQIGDAVEELPIC